MYIIIKSKQPYCKTCGNPLKEWDPFATEHEHIECASNRIVDTIMKNVKCDLKAYLINKHNNSNKTFS